MTLPLSHQSYSNYKYKLPCCLRGSSEGCGPLQTLPRVQARETVRVNGRWQGMVCQWGMPQGTGKAPHSTTPRHPVQDQTSQDSCGARKHRQPTPHWQSLTVPQEKIQLKGKTKVKNKKTILFVVFSILCLASLLMAQGDPMSNSSTTLNTIITGTWGRMTAGVLAVATGVQAYNNRHDLSHHIPQVITAVLGLTWVIFANQIISAL